MSRRQLPPAGLYAVSSGLWESFAPEALLGHPTPYSFWDTHTHTRIHTSWQATQQLRCRETRMRDACLVRGVLPSALLFPANLGAPASLWLLGLPLREEDSHQ